MRLAGIDGCKTGWIAVMAGADDFASAKLVHFQDVEAFITEQNIDFALIDMPIGFVDGPASRDVEVAMRAGLKGKASSVFSTPCRKALTEFVYGDACWINQQALGKKLSKQSFALFPKMREIDAVVRTVGQSRLREGHPEVSFSIMNGAPVLSKKRESTGAADRQTLLSQQGFDIARLLSAPRPKGCGLDDILDAAALLWSAKRLCTQKHLSFPPLPQTDAVGLEMSVVA